MAHTGTGTDDRLGVVEANDAYELAAHGPGWTIMWDHHRNRAVIARPERGDDGTLLEICRYEGMFTLGHCETREQARTCEECTPNGQPDLELIADHMTDILGDYRYHRADIAAYMPLTLPYTHALRAHGYQRRSQGSHYLGNPTRAYNTYGLEYRSPEGHRVEVIIPLAAPDSAHGDTPTPPLTIRWIYLGRIAPDGTWPITDVPADTPPADVAELIAAHIAIHPPTATPATPGDTTHGADGTGAPDRDATPLPNPAPEPNGPRRPPHRRHRGPTRPPAEAPDPGEPQPGPRPPAGTRATCSRRRFCSPFTARSPRGPARGQAAGRQLLVEGR